MGKPKMQRSWIDNEIDTSIKWPEGRSVYLRPLGPEIEVWSQVPRTKGTGRQEGKITLWGKGQHTDSRKYMYFAKKYSVPTRGDFVVLVRKLRSKKDPVRNVESALKTDDRKKPSKPKKTTGSYSTDSRQTVFNFIWQEDG